jgi:hypothetical protein
MTPTVVPHEVWRRGLCGKTWGSAPAPEGITNVALAAAGIVLNEGDPVHYCNLPALHGGPHKCYLRDRKELPCYVELARTEEEL